MIGQADTAIAAGVDQKGNPATVGTVKWSTSAAAVVTVDSATGVVTAIGAGTANIIATTGGKTGQQAISVVAPAAIKVNEIESNGGTPGDWVELFNPTAASVDVSGWILKDNDDTHSYALPRGTNIAAGGYYVVEEAAMVFGLGAPDSVRLSNQYGSRVDAYGWTTHATTTYGRCANGAGAFTTTISSTKGAANDCPAATPAASAWPGIGTDVSTVDDAAAFTENLSGLAFQAASGGSPAVIWGVVNGPGTLVRLLWNGTIWASDPGNGWSVGKALHYADGSGNPDSEGITLGGTTGAGAGGLYVSTERNNDASTVSRLSVLRYDTSGTSTSLTATNDWDLTADIPPTGANLGLEGIAYVPDNYLVSKGFYDEKAGHAYVPGEYANHGDGLFLVGVEGSGMIYAYALDHATKGYTRIATIASGYGSLGVMDLFFDSGLQYLWATCDDGCGGKTSTLEIDTSPTSATVGRFVITHVYNRPSAMPNINNEGFTIAPESECVAGTKYAYWSDDGDTDSHSLRRASMTCGRLP